MSVASIDGPGARVASGEVVAGDDGEPTKGRQIGRSKNAPRFDVRRYLFKLCGVDLTRFALKDVGLEAMSDLLNGTTSLATSTADPIVPIRMIHDMSEKMAKDEKFIVKGAFLEGKVLSDAEIAEIAQLQNKDALYSKVLGTMLAPITGLAVCLNQVVEQMGGAAAPAEAEAPAAE